MGQKMNSKNNKTGFTLVEVLTTSAILLLVLTAVYATYIMLSQFVRDTSAQTVLQSQARLAIERMINDIRLASDVECSGAGTSIKLTYEPEKMGKNGNSWTSRYRLVGDKILFSPNIDENKETTIINEVKLGSGDKLFQYDGGKKLVTIDLRTEDSSLTTTQDSHLTTVIQVRNAY